MNMKIGERRLKIFEIIKEKRHVEVNDLAQYFQVSTMTIRRDLSQLEAEGVVKTNYGGATYIDSVSSEPSFRLKSGYSHEYKKQIAYEASLLIHDGDSIFIDCGTTTLELVPFITHKNITIMSNSWRVLSKIQDFSKVKVILAPGVYDPISEGAISATTIDFLKNYSIDKAFISTQGIDIDRGVSVPTDTDAKVKKAIINCAKNKILLADHTKFHQSYMALFGQLNDFDIIFTDTDMDRETYQKLSEKHNVVLSQSYLNRNCY